MSKNKLRAVVATGLLLGGIGATTGCERLADPLVHEIVDAAHRNNMSAVGLLGLFACESEVKPGNSFRYKGHTYIGLGQHRDDLYAGRVRTHNARHPEFKVSADPRDGTSNANVTADTASREGLKPWQCETKYHCYSNPWGNRKHCKPQLWEGRVARAGGVIVGRDIVFPPPVAPPTEAPTTLPPSTTEVLPAPQLAGMSNVAIFEYARSLEAAIPVAA
jgi:hypothetical protein